MARGEVVAIKVDMRKCMGCRICEMACSLVNYNESNTKKSAIRINESHKMIGTFDVVYCNQCGICAKKCPVNAIIKEGKNWRIDEQLCTNCGICIEACPRKTIFEFEGFQSPIKCCGCNECAKVCPVQAITVVG